MTAMTTTVRPLSTLRLDTDLRRVNPAPMPKLSSQQIMTIGAPEAYRVPYADVCAVDVPETEYHPRSGNASYQPMPYASFIDGARDQMAEVLNAEPVFESYALNKAGSQLFGMIGFPSPMPGQALTVALRSSYDKTLANEVAIGSAPFVCANGCFSGEHMIKAKHTTNVFDTLARMLAEITSTAVAPVVERMRLIDGWRGIPVHDDLFAAYMGVLFGRGLVKAQEFTAAHRYWRSCVAGEMHDDHGNRDLFGAYQAVTGAGQRTSPRNAFRHFAGIDHATRAIADAGGAVTDAHIPSFDLKVREFSG
jgi:hypothetical protein